jgi:hypothetical protein
VPAVQVAQEASQFWQTLPPESNWFAEHVAQTPDVVTQLVGQLLPHGVHSAVPPVEKVVGAVHGSQVVAPGSDEWVPAAQDTQGSVVAGAVAAVEYLPAMQAVHDVAEVPAVASHVPSGQSVQKVEPAIAYLPLAHGLQLAAPATPVVLNLPASQLVQPAVPTAPASLYLPPTHCSQVPVVVSR